jgi:hypothetical protein
LGQRIAILAIDVHLPFSVRARHDRLVSVEVRICTEMSASVMGSDDDSIGPFLLIEVLQINDSNLARWLQALAIPLKCFVPCLASPREGSFKHGACG